MCILENQISPPFIQANGHLQTIIPSLFRSVQGITYTRERIYTPDDDFLDLDWCLNKGRKLAIISHGLEGDTTRSYVMGMVKTFQQGGDWDVLAWNCRGCSQEINRQLRFYHSGATEDLGVVIDHAINLGRYSEIGLIGFSMGGNITLKYLGEKAKTLPAEIFKAAVFSVPVDLLGSCKQLSRSFNYIYSYRFLRKLKAKVRKKAEIYPDAFDLQYLNKVSRLMQFDEAFTAPIHGFSGALDYYQKCSSQRLLEYVGIPTLIVNAKNDPFLSESCYPYNKSRINPLLKLLVPAQGGHCGFRNKERNYSYYSEYAAWQYFNN